MSSSDAFWAAKKRELKNQGVLVDRSDYKPPGQPWWAQGSKIMGQQPEQPQQPSEDHTALPESRLTPAVNANKESCPSCGGTDYMRPSASAAPRCFACGYVHGRQLNEPNLPSAVSTNIPKIAAKQLPSQGHFGKTAEEINQNNAVLEQSALGRTRLA